MNKNTKLVAALGTAVMTIAIVPAIAFAHLDLGVQSNTQAQIQAQHHDGSDNEATETNEANVSANGVMNLGDGAVLPMFFTKGAVTAVSSTGFTMTVNGGAKNSVVVNTDGARMIRLPNTAITLADIKVNDRVWVQGQTDGSTINADVVYDLDATVAPAKAKGTVTAISGGTLTVQTKNGQTVTVNTDSNTQVVKNGGAVGATSDITVGSNVGIRGLWNSVLNILQAIKIRLFS